MIYFLMAFSVAFALFLYFRTERAYDKMIAVLKKDNEEWLNLLKKYDKALKEQDFKMSRVCSKFSMLVIADTEEEYREIVGKHDSSDILWAKAAEELKYVRYNGTFELIISPHILTTIKQYDKNKKDKKKAELIEFYSEARRLLEEEGNYHFKKRQFIES